MDLKQYVRDVPDFPKPGILFKDITPLLASPQAFSAVLDWFVFRAAQVGAQAIAGVESRGFIFGAPVAANLKLPFVPIRKAGKLPSATVSVEYALEYGTAKLDIHKDALNGVKRVVVIDDLLASGGTAQAASHLVEAIGGQVVGLMFVIELLSLGGRSALSGREVDALLSYS